VREEKERAEAERRRHEAEERRRREEARVQALFKEVESWDRSRRIRHDLPAVETLALSRHGRIDPGSEMDSWLKWAAGVADRTDPLMRG
jgi:hypothetical protein